MRLAAGKSGRPAPLVHSGAAGTGGAGYAPREADILSPPLQNLSIPSGDWKVLPAGQH